MVTPGMGLGKSYHTKLHGVLLCFALPCLALPCFALLCFALHCVALLRFLQCPEATAAEHVMSLRTSEKRAFSQDPQCFLEAQIPCQRTDLGWGITVIGIPGWGPFYGSLYEGPLICVNPSNRHSSGERNCIPATPKDKGLQTSGFSLDEEHVFEKSSQAARR